MMPFIIKICGITTHEHVRVLQDNGASWYGLVFHKQSPRYIELRKAEKIVKKSPSSISPVAVTVNPNESFIKDLTEIGIKNIQLHGNETPDYCLLLKKKFNIKIGRLKTGTPPRLDGRTINYNNLEMQPADNEAYFF